MFQKTPDKTLKQQPLQNCYIIHEVRGYVIMYTSAALTLLLLGLSGASVSNTGCYIQRDRYT